MVDKVADDIGVTKIHAESHAGILQGFAVVVGNVDGIAKKRLVDRLAAVINQQEMQLMNMERVQFAGAVFDDPSSMCPASPRCSEEPIWGRTARAFGRRR